MESIMDYLKREGTAFDGEMARAIPKERKPWEVYGIIWEHLSLGGKRLRPVMCKLSCEAVGGKGKSVLGIGAAIELFHNFCVPGDTQVLTKNGFLPIQELGHGEDVCSLDVRTGTMRHCRAERLYENGVRETYRLESKNRAITATANHPFLVFATRHPEKFRLSETGRGKVRAAAKEKGVSLNALSKILLLPKGSKNWWTSGKSLISGKELSRLGRFLAISFSDADATKVAAQTQKIPLFEWRLLKDLRKGDLVVVSRSGAEDGTALSLPKIGAPLNGVTLPKETSERFCQVAGLFLGDGCVTLGARGSSFCISLPRGELQEKYAKILCEVFGKPFHTDKNNIYLGSKALCLLFDVIGFNHPATEKKIPEWVFALPRRQKLAFLRGYLDSDGTVNTRGETIFGSASYRLIAGLKLLVDSLGFTSGHVRSKVVQNLFPNAVKKESTIYELELSNPGKILSEIGTEDSRYLQRLSRKRRKYEFRHVRETGACAAGLDFSQFGLNPVRSITAAGERQVYDLLVEGAHNFIAEGVVAHNTLLHDDIEDCSEVRRGQPCMYKKYGIPLAINAGDGLFMNVWQEILDSGLPPEKIVEVQRVLNNAFMRVLEGQAVELNWYRENRLDISEDEYMGMIAGKTGALISASCGVGALIGGASAEQGKALSDFGMAVGLAFQIQDDVLNLVGKEEKYGKEIGGDISEGKRSLITIRALSRASGRQRKRLSEILLARTKDQKEIAEAISICRETGAIDYAAGKAKDLVGKAKEGIMVLPNNEASRRLLQLADFFIYREV